MTTNGSSGLRLTSSRWTVATSLGLGLGFLSFVPGMMVMDVFLPAGLTNMGPSSMPEALDPSALPDWLDERKYSLWYRMHLGYHVLALAIFGGILGWLQSRRLREHIAPRNWIIATSAGYVAVLVFEIFERHVVIGPHAGPVEPLMISIGGSILAGAGQWFVLHQSGVNASRWLIVWVLGIVVGVGIAVSSIIGLEFVTRGLPTPELTGVLADAALWGGMLFIFGSVSGAVAGATSARELRRCLLDRQSGTLH